MCFVLIQIIHRSKDSVDSVHTHSQTLHRTAWPLWYTICWLVNVLSCLGTGLIVGIVYSSLNLPVVLVDIALQHTYTRLSTLWHLF